jgi:hypothetical protein
MKTLAVLLSLTATIVGTCAAQNCFGLKPLELPPLGHPNASQQCVCETMNRGCHYAWVDQPNSTTTPGTGSTPAYTNQFDQALRDRIAAQRREKELREERPIIEEQNDRVNDMEIIKAVHDGVLVPLEPGEQTSLPTIRNSSGQEFRVVPPASSPMPGHSSESGQFTHGFLNGRKWVTMSEAERASYVSEFLHEYAHTCFRTSANATQQKACYAKLGNRAHVNPDNPGEIVDGVSGLYAASENLDLTIIVAIKAASMKASGESQDGIDRYLQTERNAIAVAAK